MTDAQGSLPPGFKHWPPNPKELMDEIEAAWASQQGRHGKHWALQIFGENPISGYRVIIQPTG